MKKIPLLITVTLFFLFGCEQITDSPSTPIEELGKKQSFQNENTDAIRVSIIPLPEKSPIYLDSIFTVTKLINGLLGGTITLDKMYISKEGKPVTILLKMVILPLSFTGQRQITVTIEDSIAVMNCGPSMNFRQALICNQTFTGLDLNDFESKEIDFVYIHNNYTFSEVPKTTMIVNKALGLVSVVDARISHFSKYGWVRKHGNPN